MDGTIRVAVNGYGVIGKRVADAVTAQADMTLVGVADIASDWRTRVLEPKGIAFFAGDEGPGDSFHSGRNLRKS